MFKFYCDKCKKEISQNHSELPFCLNCYRPMFLKEVNIK